MPMLCNVLLSHAGAVPDCALRCSAVPLLCPALPFRCYAMLSEASAHPRYALPMRLWA